MDKQRSIFDAEFEADQRAKREGIAARDDALERVEHNANERWKQEAQRAVIFLARTRDEFTTDDVWEVMEASDSRTHEPRAMGAIMTAATKAGIISPARRWQPSKRPQCHRRPVAVWLSNARKGV